MQIIIEFKNPNLLSRLLGLLRGVEWLNGIKVWKKADEETQPELILDATSSAPGPSGIPNTDYLEFWACIQPKLGLEATDRIFAEMRED